MNQAELRKLEEQRNSAVLALHRTRDQTSIDESLYAQLMTARQDDANPELSGIADEILSGFFETLVRNYKKIING